jgi:DNA-binding transcriptional MocR family regulator
MCREHRPKALYCTPTLHNPTTATLPLDRRQALIEIARRHQVPIIEDDAYGALPAQAPPALAALAPDLTWHIATLSKCATPALRVAYVVAPTVTGVFRIAGDIRATSLMAPSLMTSLATRWIQNGTLSSITAAIRREAAARQQIAARALRQFSFAADPAGHHLWLSLPEGWTQNDLGADTRKVGLSVVASDAFAVSEVPAAVRISLGAAPSRDGLERGLGVLAAVLSGSPRAIPGIV